MQILYHKSRGLTIAQKFFIERSIELLYRNTIDSYRVKVKNPKTVVKELRDTILAFEKGQIKHFLTIASKDKTKFALKDEVLDLLALQPNYLNHQTFSADYFKSILQTLDEGNYKRVKDCASVLLKENEAYLDKVLNGLILLAQQNADNEESLMALLEKLDITLGILYTELLEIGFSKGFLHRLVMGIFASLGDGDSFDDALAAFITRLKMNEISYLIVFRIDTTKTVRESMQTIDGTSEVCFDLDDFNHLAGDKEFDNFTAPQTRLCYVKCSITAPDYLAALKKAKVSLAENLDVLNLGFGDEHYQRSLQQLLLRRTTSYR